MGTSRAGALSSRFATARETGRTSGSPTRAGAAITSQVESLARQLADDIIRERDRARSRARLGRIYTTFDNVEDILPNNVETLTRGLFSGNTGSLTQGMFTSSTATAIQKSYFIEVFNQNPSTATSAEVQFSIAWGHYNGSGSEDQTGNLNNDTPSRAIYKQYAQILLPPNDFKFTFNGTDSDNIYVLNFNRTRFREKLDPGNLEINLRDAASPNTFVLRLVDDSSVTSAAVGEGGLVYNIVSGSIDDGTTIYSPTRYYGLMYPQYGIVILNGDALDAADTATQAGITLATGLSDGVEGENRMKVFTAISASIGLAPAGQTHGIQARSSEQVKSTYYFVRVKNGEYNYSNNPTFTTGSLGQLRYPTFYRDPQTYITTVGLYNDRRELLAVAKLSRPLLKSFTREALIKVKLDF
jgi:hypothetical protein